MSFIFPFNKYMLTAGLGSRNPSVNNTHTCRKTKVLEGLKELTSEGRQKINKISKLFIRRQKKMTRRRSWSAGVEVR